MTKFVSKSLFLFSLCVMSVCSDETSYSTTAPPEGSNRGITVNFQDVSMLEFLRYVSKIAEVNFIYDDEILDFKINLVTGKESTPESVLSIMIELLQQQGIKTEERGEYLLVRKMEEGELEALKTTKVSKYGREERGEENLFSINYQESPLTSVYCGESEKREDFHVYKLQYHQGEEILTAIKNISPKSHHHSTLSGELLQTISTMQWMQSTNSILYSGTKEGIDQLSLLINSLDVPKKQVFIEVLVIETDIKSGQEFGLEWGGKGRYHNKFEYSFGNFSPDTRQPSLGEAFHNIGGTDSSEGTTHRLPPAGRGFDLGVIGDVIFHKGLSYLSLGSLVSALEKEGNSSIILNQKIITQDNKLSSIFVGDNIPFTGSVIETIGAAQQTSSNIEYRDVGVKLNITPLLGEGDMITLDITEEITEIVHDPMQLINRVNGIQTTKTDMATQVHIPDQSFLVLSGMIRNTKRQHRAGIPCLGGLPFIGAAFSKMITNDEKKNIIIFVRPQIINSREDYQNITAKKERQFNDESTNTHHYQKELDRLKNESFPPEEPHLPPAENITTKE